MRTMITAVVLALALGPAAGAQTQGQMNDEAAASYKAADRALNAVYVRLAAQASPGGRARLRTAQRDWLKYRDSDCEARAGSRGGSFYPTALATCLEDNTRARTKVLKDELSCPETDMGCGGHRVD